MQRILLCSDQHERQTPETNSFLFEELKETNQKILYFPSEPDPSQKYFSKVAEYYSLLGFSDVSYFGIDTDYDFHRMGELTQCDVFHLSGGRPLPFVRALQARGFRRNLDEHLLRGGLILGVSAGAMVLGKTLFGESSSAKTPKKVPRALGLLPFDVVPHYAGTRSEDDEMAVHQNRSESPLWALGNDSVLICERASHEESWKVRLHDPFEMSRFFKV